MWKVAIVGAALTMAAQAAQAAPQCNERKNVLDLLANKYAESQVAFGVTTNGGLVEVLKSSPGAKDDTWTIIITSPEGVSCLVAAGEGWKYMEQVVQGPQT